MMEDNEEEGFTLYNVSSWEFDFIYEFLQLHRNQPPETVRSLKPEIPLRDVMEEADA